MTAKKTSDRPEPQGLCVAGIVASAGGLDAFRKLLSAMPSDSGIALVLVPHLDPARKSLMVDLLTSRTSMPVVEVEDHTPVAANHVYVIPPNEYLVIRDGVLRLTGPVERHASQASIDRFLRSLAEDQRERAICVILSGTGAHGTLGLKAIKAAGGMAMVQDPMTADYASMPRSAVATGLADYVLPVEQMPEALIGYTRHRHANVGTVDLQGEGKSGCLSQVLAVVRARTKLDFRSYRKKMLACRVERRMSLNQFERIDDYLVFLREHPDEVGALAKDLLLSVTGFFRDAEAWHALETEVIVPMIRAKGPDEPLRVWSVGCSTGEEPYSLGMLLLEHITAARKNCPVQIFATDVDEAALEVARQGIYPDSIAADVSPERLARFFTRVSDTAYQVSKQLRETVTFARQNLITEAPFSRLDLVVCRNLLIYLEPEIQKKVVALLHFALTEGGYLFLGSSETIGRSVDLFEPVSAKRRIYRRIGPTRVNNLQFPVMEPESRTARTQPAVRSQPPARLAEIAHNFLLRRYALACMVINRNYEVLHFAGPTEDYLIQPGGPPTHDLLAMARPGLEPKLRVVIQRTIRQNAAQSVQGVMMHHSGVSRRVSIDVEPLDQSKQTEGLLLVSVQELPGPSGETLAEEKARTQTADTDMIRQLEQELDTTREDLQSTIEELESSNEELKASNEEIMSMNEELQSTNEELETSKEELQSLNEELSTVNNQLHDKVRELEAANNDIANLFNCTDIPTVFLDAELRIRRYTPAATRLFNLIPTDVGRPLGDLGRRFTDEDLLGDAREVLGTLTPREREVTTEDKRWHARRIVPYRTVDNHIDGVVITFVDITARKQEADATYRRLAAIVESSVDAIYSKTLDGTLLTWNAGAERLYGHTTEEMIGQSIRRIIPDDRIEEWEDIMARLRRGESIEQLETERVRKDGRRIPVALTLSPLRDDQGRLTGVSITARGLAERKAAEAALIAARERLEAILNTASDAIVISDRHGVIQSVNPAAEVMFGYTTGELIGRPVDMILSGPQRQAPADYMTRYSDSGGRRSIATIRELEVRRRDGETLPVELAISEIEHLQLFTAIVRDISRRRQLEREVVEIASLQQRSISYDLHDSVGQEVTALSLLAGELAETVRTEPARSQALVARISDGIRRIQQALRGIMLGLLPVAVETEGLMAALTDLVEQTRRQGSVDCTLECGGAVTVDDHLVATHLYLIVQEAVHNALKHARARAIRIHVASNRHLSLSVRDDGIGLSEPPSDHAGLGLRIMHNRAAIIGATLTVEPARPTGTVVTCTLHRRSTHERGRDDTARPGPDRR